MAEQLKKEEKVGFFVCLPLRCRMRAAQALQACMPSRAISTRSTFQTPPSLSCVCVCAQVRNMVNKELPKLREKLRAAVEEYEASVGLNLKISGQRIIDILGSLGCAWRVYLALEG